jgi:hypothetical protein
MLDESGKIFFFNFLGSMHGKPWQDLIKSVDSLFKKISNDITLAKIIKCTVINYSGYSRIIFQEKIVSDDLIDIIDFESGSSTCFLNVMNKAIGLIDYSHKEYDVIKLVMMSDGGATYPYDEIRVLNSRPYRNKLNFESIMFGNNLNGIQKLSQMAQDLGGKYSHAVTLENLTKSFIEIVNIKFA